MKKLILILALASGLNSTAQVNPADSLALLNVLGSMGYSSLMPFGSCNPLTAPASNWCMCTWSHTGANHLSLLNTDAFYNNTLTGTLHPDIGLLSEVHTIEIQRQQYLTGPIPAEIGNLNNLKQLAISWVDFKSIPDEIGNLTSLRALSLQGDWVDNLPATIGNLASLETFNLFDTQLNCEIPLWLGGMPNLNGIVFVNNESMYGSIPDTFLINPSVEGFIIRNCNISGSISPRIGENPNVYDIDISHNHIGGTIPDEILNRSHLYLTIVDNEFTGLPVWPNDNQRHIDSLQYNRLTFEDFEPSVASGGIQYLLYIHPQDSTWYPLDTTVLIGTPVLLDATVGGTANVYQWYKNGTAIPGATQAQLYTSAVSYTDSGTYTCRVWNTIVTPVKYLHLDRHCIHLKVVNSLSQNDILQNAPGIFPNPAHCRVTIRNGNEPITTITITDLNGRIVRLSHPNQPVVLLDISDLPTGAYNVTVEAEKAKWSETMVVGD